METSSRTAERMASGAARLVRLLKAADQAPRLSGAEASALAVVIHAEGISPSALAKIEDVSRPTIARTIAALTKRGLVRRDGADDDARSVRLTATPSGRRLFEDGGRRRAAPLAALIDELSSDDQADAAAAAGMLERLVEAFASGARPTANSSRSRRGSRPRK